MSEKRANRDREEIEDKRVKMMENGTINSGLESGPDGGRLKEGSINATREGK